MQPSSRIFLTDSDRKLSSGWIITKAGISVLSSEYTVQCNRWGGGTGGGLYFTSISLNQLQIDHYGQGGNFTTYVTSCKTICSNAIY